MNMNTIDVPSSTQYFGAMTPRTFATDEKPPADEKPKGKQSDKSKKSKPRDEATCGAAKKE